MSKSKTILELLIILRDELIYISAKDFHDYKGLCYLSESLVFKKISVCEYFLLSSYITRSMPHNYKNYQYMAKPGLKTPRLKWLNERIKSYETI